MSYDPIDSADLEAGKPIRQVTQQKIKDNFEDHEQRLQAIEGYVAIPPVVLSVNGPYSLIYQSPGLFDVTRTWVTFDLRLLNAFLIIKDAGSAGITQIDIRLVRAGASPVSIFTTPPSVSYTAGDQGISTNQVINPIYRDLLEDDILILDITSTQTNASGFLVRLDVVKQG